MRGVAKALYEKEAEIEIYGILDGYKGLIYGNRKKMKPSDFSGILTIGGTILGTSRQPFKQMQVPDEQGLDKVKAIPCQSYFRDATDFKPASRNSAFDGDGAFFVHCTCDPSRTLVRVSEKQLGR